MRAKISVTEERCWIRTITPNERERKLIDVLGALCVFKLTTHSVDNNLVLLQSGFPLASKTENFSVMVGDVHRVVGFFEHKGQLIVVHHDDNGSGEVSYSFGCLTESPFTIEADDLRQKNKFIWTLVNKQCPGFQAIPIFPIKVLSFVEYL